MHIIQSILASCPHQISTCYQARALGIDQALLSSTPFTVLGGKLVRCREGLLRFKLGSGWRLLYQITATGYREDCQKVFGRFIDHYPYFGIYGQDDYQELKNAFAQTVALYEKHFGAYPGGGNEAQAMRCKDHACHVPTSCACRVEGACN